MAACKQTDEPIRMWRICDGYGGYVCTGTEVDVHRCLISYTVYH